MKLRMGFKGTFRLSTVDNKVERNFSKRDKIIDEIAEKEGADSYAATRNIVVETRPYKEYTTVEEKDKQWREEALNEKLNIEFEKHKSPIKIKTVNHSDKFELIKNKTYRTQFFI